MSGVGRYYYYKKTIRPEKFEEDCRFYHHSSGFIGYKYPRPERMLLYHGTVDEFLRYLENKKTVKHGVSWYMKEEFF